MKFIIATGGTGGHFVPAMKVARELKAQGHDVVFCGSFSRVDAYKHGNGFVFEELGAKGLVLGWRRDMFSSIGAMFKATKKARNYIKQYQPDAVIGFGGYGAFPAVFAAVLLRIPTLIHEQNVMPGKANALLAKFVKKIAISFNKSSQYFNAQKTVFTGCPCHIPRDHFDRSAILELFHLKPDRKTILVMGGSQGSSRINNIFLETVIELKKQIDIQVIHVSGKQDYARLNNQYKELGIPFALFEFLDKMEEAYHVADLVISRSGAATVSEVAGFQLPAIFIPYPFAQGHQKENASVLCESQSAIMIEDNHLSASKLKEVMIHLLNTSPPNRNQSSPIQDICIVDAAQRLAREAIKLKV